MKAEVTYWEITPEGREEKGGAVAVEHTTRIFVNGKPWVALLSSPVDLEELAVGFLQSEGVIEKLEDIQSVEQKGGDVWIELRRQLERPDHIITSGGGRTASVDWGLEPLEGGESFDPRSLIALSEAFAGYSQVWKATHGVHSAALCTPSQILVFKEDLGRHNAVDKVFGHCLLRGINYEGMILFLSGRISSEMVLKAARRRIPLVASLASPTDKALEIAKGLRVTVVGSARGGRLKVFTHPERLS